MSAAVAGEIKSTEEPSLAAEEKTAGGRGGGGELLYCGGTQWELLGRKHPATSRNLAFPTRLSPLLGVDIRFVASGSMSCHCVALDVEGRCYTWGRNEKGQLGHGDIRNRSLPTIVTELLKYKIVKAGAGRNHTVVVTDDGKSFSFGMNKHGQLGSGATKNEIETSPVQCLVSQATNAACGADFTVWLSSVDGSSILTAGLPQYGQLGHGSNNEYNSKDSSIRLAYEPQPRPRAIAAFAEKNVVKVACGSNHTVAVDSNGFVYTWGFGGYGRLGHREQKDEWKPRLVEVFQKHNVLPPTAVVSAGSMNSACTAGGGQLYMWGKIKNTGDDWMYPKPLMDLSGWNIRCMDSGHMHHVVGADDSCISWGHAQYGELGYGPNGQKSSANPKKVDILDGLHVISVACGVGLSLIVVDRSNVGDRLDELEVYDGKAEEEDNNDENTAVAKGTPKKRGTANSANSRKRKKKDDPEDSEGASENMEEDGSLQSEEDEGENSEDDANGEAETARGKRGGRGRGKKVAIDVNTPKRGRGRPPKSGNEKSSSGRGRGRGRGRPGRKSS